MPRKSKKVSSVPVQPEIVSIVPTLSKGQKLWNEIKNKDIDVFASPKKVFDYCEPAEIDPDKCYLKITASAVLPALEASLGSSYTCELAHKYVLVERVDGFLNLKK